MSALTSLAAKTAQRQRAQEEWEEALVEASREHSLRQVAPAAGVSHARVAQILAKEKDLAERISWYVHA